MKIREDFHDKPHSRQQRVSWEWPRDFFEVGDSEAVLYRSDKWQADGKKIDYKHVKEGPQKLLLRQDFVVDARGSRLRLDGMKLHGPYIDMQGDFPDSFAVLAESLGLQARLYANDEGTRYQDYVELRFAKGAKLGAGKFADGSTFVFVYDSTGPLAVVIGEELDVLKDGIVG